MPSQDGLPPVEVIQDASETRSEAVVISGRESMRRWVLAAVAIVVVVGFSFTTRTGGDASSEDGAVPSSSGAGRHQYVTGVERPVFGAPVRASVLIGSEADGWRILRLDTGRIEDVPLLEGTPSANVVAVRGGVVVLDDETSRLSMVSLTPDGDPFEAGPIDFLPDRPDPAGGVAGVLAAGNADQLWVVLPPRRHSSSGRATLVSSDGRPVVRPFVLSARPVAGTEAGLVYNAGGRIYLAGPRGLDELGPGTAYGASATSVGRVACDHVGQCRQEVVDLRSGSVTRSARVATAAASQDAITMAFSDTGVLATLASYLPGASPTLDGGESSTTLYVTDPAEPPRGIVVDEPLAGPAWLPGGDGVILLGDQGLVRYSVTDGRLVGEEGPPVGGGPGTSLIVVPDGDR